MSIFRHSRSLILLGIACLALRAIIPAGYMPGNLLAGDFMVLCPAGLPAGTAQSIHQDHDENATDVVDVDRSCPIGSALQPAWLPTDLVEQQVSIVPPCISAGYSFLSATTTQIHRYDSRAPPRV